MIGLLVYVLFIGTAPDIVYRSGETGSYYLTHKVNPMLSDIVGFSLFIAPFVQFPVTVFALIGGLFRNRIIKFCISWPIPILMFVWTIRGIPGGETENGVGTNLVTPDSPLSLKIITGLESNLPPCLMSVVWVYFVAYIFVPDLKNSIRVALRNRTSI